MEIVILVNLEILSMLIHIIYRGGSRTMAKFKKKSDNKLF